MAACSDSCCTRPLLCTVLLVLPAALQGRLGYFCPYFTDGPSERLWGVSLKDHGVVTHGKE